MPNFTIYPAIDLRGGNCVRLYKGDYEQETIYDTNPVDVARKWKNLGAEFLHIIDLDGARSAKPENLAVATEIAKATGLRIQFGGGIRNYELAKQVLAAGVERIILGSSVLKNPEFVKRILGENAESVIIGMDCRKGRIAVEGWLEDSDVTAVALAEELKKYGLKRVNYTDIERDGTLEGPNFEETEEFARSTGVSTIASGGVSGLADVKRLRELGSPVDGVIIGKALYTGRIDPEELFEFARSK